MFFIVLYTIGAIQFLSAKKAGLKRDGFQKKSSETSFSLIIAIMIFDYNKTTPGKTF
jgi:hypothetical protein